MRYPILIEPATATTCYGVVVPDLPGCNSAGDTLVEAVSNAEEAAALWLDVALDEGEAIPLPSDPATLVVPPGWIIGLISVDPDALDDTIERINITIARRALSRLDAQARAARQSRSAYITSLSLHGRAD